MPIYPKEKFVKLISRKLINQVFENRAHADNYKSPDQQGLLCTKNRFHVYIA
jgi:hypothetical protein